MRPFMEAGTILSDGVLSPLDREPLSMSHSEAMGIAVRIFVRRGTCVLIRLFSVLTSSPSACLGFPEANHLTIHSSHQSNDGRWPVS